MEDYKKKIQLGQIEALPELQKLKKQKLNPDASNMPI